MRAARQQVSEMPVTRPSEMAGSGKIAKMLTWVGPAVDDDQLIERLPSPLSESLRSRNGYISALGGFHLRGVCVGPEWHSIRAAWEGPDAIHRLFPTVLCTDIPFAQDCFGDQFLIRNGKVLRLESETGTVQTISPNWVTFMEAVEGDAFTFLRLQPLKRFQDQGGILAPGQLLSVYPPFVAVGGGASIIAIDAKECLSALADFARQIRDVKDGEQVRIVPKLE